MEETQQDQHPAAGADAPETAGEASPGAAADTVTEPASEPAMSGALPDLETMTPDGEGDGGADPPGAPAPRRGGGRAFAVIVVLLLLAAAAWWGWNAWQARPASAPPAVALAPVDDPPADASAASAALAALDTRLAALEARADAQPRRDERIEALEAQARDTAGALTALEPRLEGLTQRVAALESATARLAEARASGAERMRLEDVEMLLTQAGQRYALLRDGAGALAALRLAREELQVLDDPALGGVTRTLDDEIRALAATRPEAWAERAAALQTLRATWSTLPRKPADTADTAPPGPVWTRLRQALSSLIVVSHDPDAAEIEAVDARLGLHLARLDLATAQAALLDHDADAARAALGRVRAVLSAELDPASAAVRRADAELERLSAALASDAAVDVQLGAALSALRNQRQVRRMGAATARTR